ncbi:tetratricopeptide repeat protein [Desulfovibrio sp.]|uniref:tetratricopeptide repeat protein n=1 Tax=Desulfovibrio sp. TaxID=885 RepID=UPI0025BB4519|nr:tetratricopeptide repeat protein [Desulfovibrio sp.]
MTEKIEWYKEVLDLEPNSKVFFPLARLLAEARRTDEAVEVLERGLKRHDEFLEARIFLIELLYKAGEQAACEKQVEKLSKMLTAYAGFWQAWAASLASEAHSPDAAAVMNFLALNFARGPVSLQEVMERGVNSLLGQDVPSSTVHRQPKKNETPGNASGASKDVKASLEDEGAAAFGSQPASSFLDHKAAIAPHSDSSEQSADLPEDSLAKAVPVDDTLSAVHSAHQHLAHEHLTHDELATFDPDKALDEVLPPQSDHTTAYEASPVAEEATIAPDTAVEDPSAHGDEGNEEGEERFSLRTRSMAEVLAEQGDTKGALDIYHELAAAATAPEESADLRQRIATLNARLGSAQAEEPAPDTATPEAASGKDKLISMLEALAERVEARAHS